MALQSIKYESSAQKGSPCTVLYTGSTGETISASELTGLIGRCTEEIVVLVDGDAVHRDLINQALQMMSRSKSIGFVYYEPSPTLCFRKGSISIEKLGNELLMSSLIATLVDFANAERKASGILLLQPLYDSAGKVSFAELIKDKPISFSTVGATFTAVSATPLTIEVTKTGVTEQQLVARIQGAIELLNQNRDKEALTTLIEINQQAYIPELFFVQAIAEVRLQQYKAAGRSLLILLENDPRHSEGQKLMNELRSSFLA